MEEFDIAGPASIRDAYREALLELALQNPLIWCCDSDMGGLEDGFARRLPGQYVDLGIAEANLMSVCAALAASGKIPFANTMASFAVLRAGEQLKIDIAYNALPVHIAASHAGLSGGHFGPTHHSLEDLAVTRALPNLTVVVPSDAAMVRQMLPALAALPGPSYLRMGRKATPACHREGARFELGSAAVLRGGDDVTLIACGPAPILASLAAHDRLAALGIGARVLEMATVKPLDVDAVVAAATDTGGIVTVEEHSIVGGLGGAVAEAVTQHAPTRVQRIGMPDCFAQRVGDQQDLLQHYGIDEPNVTRAALALLGVNPASHRGLTNR